MAKSILTTTKEFIGIPEACSDFDSQLISDINSVLFTLHQIGAGPSDIFLIEGPNDTWDDLGRFSYSPIIQDYVHKKVKLTFDPPNSSFHLEALKAQIAEVEWRLRIQSEEERGY